MVTSRDPAGNRNRQSPGYSPPSSTYKHGGRQVHAPAPDSSPSPRGRLVVAVPGPTACPGGCTAWGAFSAQTPPARPFSQPAPTSRQRRCPAAVTAPPVSPPSVPWSRPSLPRLRSPGLRARRSRAGVDRGGGRQHPHSDSVRLVLLHRRIKDRRRIGFRRSFAERITQRRGPGHSARRRSRPGTGISTVPRRSI